MSCKTINIDLTNVPPVPIQIGVAGENSFRTITFDASKWGADYPDATYTVVYRRSDGYLYPVLVNASADAIVWNPTGTDTAVSGNGQLEVRLLDGETIGKTIIMQTYVAPSLSGDESEPSTPAPDWVNDVADDADRAEAAVSHYPQIRDGYWWVWDAESGEWKNTNVKATGEGGSSATVVVTIDGTTDPVTASMTAAEIKAAVDRGERVVARYSGVDVPYVAYADQTAVFAVIVDFGNTPTTAAIMIAANGAATIDATLLAAYDDLPTSQEMANAAPVQSVNGKTGSVMLTAADVNALPSSTVIPTVPQMATDPDMTGWTSGKTADAAVLKRLFEIVGTAISRKANASDIPTAVSELTNDSGYQTASDVQTAISGVRQLPTGGTTGDFLRKDSNGNAVWETIPTYQGGSY